MNAYQKLEGLLSACQNANSMWERQALLAAFYDQGVLSHVVVELAQALPKKETEPFVPTCDHCGNPAIFTAFVEQSAAFKTCGACASNAVIGGSELNMTFVPIKGVQHVHPS